MKFIVSYIPPILWSLCESVNTYLAITSFFFSGWPLDTGSNVSCYTSYRRSITVSQEISLLFIFIIHYLILNTFYNRLFPLEHHAIKRRSQLKHCDSRRPSKHQHPRWNYSTDSKRQRIEFTIQILPIFLLSVSRFNRLLSLAPSWSGYVYFTHNLLLAHGDSTVFLESEMCKGLDSWWVSIKRNISRLLLVFTGDEAIQPKLKRNVSCIWYRF